MPSRLVVDFVVVFLTVTPTPPALMLPPALASFAGTKSDTDDSTATLVITGGGGAGGGGGGRMRGGNFPIIPVFTPLLSPLPSVLRTVSKSGVVLHDRLERVVARHLRGGQR